MVSRADFNIVCFSVEDGVWWEEYFDAYHRCEICDTEGSWLVDEQSGVGLCERCLIEQYDVIIRIKKR